MSHQLMRESQIIYVGTQIHKHAQIKLFSLPPTNDRKLQFIVSFGYCLCRLPSLTLSVCHSLSLSVFLFPFLSLTLSFSFSILHFFFSLSFSQCLSLPLSHTVFLCQAHNLSHIFEPASSLSFFLSRCFMSI